MEKSQFILFPKSLLSSNSSTKLLMLMLLAQAEESENKGTIITSENAIAKELGITRWQAKSCINNLVELGLVNKHTTSGQQATNKPSTSISICNYDCYTIRSTSKKQAANKQTTSKQQARASIGHSEDDEGKPMVEPTIISTSKDDCVFEEVNPKTQREIEFDKFNVWVDKEVPLIRKIKEQLTFEQFCNLLDVVRVPKQELVRLIQDLGNKAKYVKEHNSVNLTIQNWYRRDQQKNNGNRQPNNSMAATQQRINDFLQYRADYDQRERTPDDDVPLF